MDAIIADLFRVLILVSATASAIQSRRCQESCCDKNRFISLNRTLAPLEMITASGSISTSYSATNVYNFGFNGDSSSFRTWCTYDFDSDHPYIDMRFTSPVLITEVVCSGTTRLNFQSTSTTTTRRSVYYYVTNFTIEFSPPDDNTNLTYYTTEDGGNIQYFTVPWLNAQISLDKPLLTQRIRIRPIDWLDTDTTLSLEYVCLGVGLYGCLASEVDTETVLAETTTVDEQEATTTQSFTDGRPTAAAQVVVRDYQALAIVLPIALLTIIINAAIVVAGVYFCFVMKGQKKNGKTNGYVGEKSGQSHATRSLEISTRSLDLSQSGEHFGSNLDGRGATIHVVKNIIYGSSPVPAADMDTTSRGEPVFMSANESGYEPVDHDGVDARNENGEDDELEFNMSYGRVDFELQPVQDHSTSLELKGNESYNSVSTTPIFDDVEYSYPATHFAPVKIQ